MSLLSNTYKILSIILQSTWTPYAGEISGYHQCAFRRNRPTTDHIFCVRHILGHKWEKNVTMRQLFIDFKKAYDSVRRDFGIPVKLVRIMKMCLNETYSRVRVGKNLSDLFPIMNGLK